MQEVVTVEEQLWLEQRRSSDQLAQARPRDVAEPGEIEVAEAGEASCLHQGPVCVCVCVCGCVCVCVLCQI